MFLYTNLTVEATPLFKKPGTIASQLPDNAGQALNFDFSPSSPQNSAADPFWSPSRLNFGAITASSLKGAAFAAAAEMETVEPSMLVSRWRREVAQAAAAERVSPAALIAIMSVESRGISDALSHKGARGLMQLMPATAAQMGVKDVSDPAQNIQGGARYFSRLLKQFDENPIVALAAYNAGDGAVRRAGGVPDYPETRAYVKKVLAAWWDVRKSCLHAPEDFRAPCVFVRR